MLKNLRILILVIFCGNSVSAQDAHFSQMRQSNAYLNPGFTGLFDRQADIRATALYRKQWSFNPSYRDFMVGLEKSGAKWGFGAGLWGQDAGANSLQTTGGKASVSVHQALGGAGNSLNFGVGLGFVQQKFDAEKLTFHNQYDATNGYSADNASGETFTRTSRTVPDFSAGLVLQKRTLGNKVDIEGGFSFSNLSRPASSFFSEETETRQWKTAFHSTIKIKMASNVGLEPFFWYIKQGKAKNQVFGADVKFSGGQNKWSLGMGKRIGDAFLFRLGLDLKNQFIGLSYDVNTSGLNAVSSGRGAWELAWIGYFSTKKIQRKPVEINEPILPNAPKGQVLDSDGDGIVDTRDQCPEEAGLIRFYGCNDMDGDEVPDQKDQCPSLPGKISRAGCPELDGDSDGDGIIDVKDNCPYIRGVAEFKGCPDTDEDGIPDLSDNCPYLKGIAANRGCPVEGPAPVGDMPEALVEFDTDLSVIKPQYYNSLKEFATWMRQHPTRRVIISGHTDAEGNAEYNNNLSLRRSQAVRDFLIGQGVEASRTKIVHYGENMPKSSNKDVSGKAQNRRVELQIYGN